MKKGYEWLLRRGELQPDKFFTANKVVGLTPQSFIERVENRVEYLKNNNLTKCNRLGLTGKNCIEYLSFVFAFWKLGITPVLFNTRWTEKEIRDTAEKFNITRLINIESEGLEVSLKRLSKERESEAAEKDTAVIIFTSGTSGYPKAVEITFDNLKKNFEIVKQLTDLNEKDVWVASLPFYHIGGFAIMTRALLGGNVLAIPESLKSEHIKKVSEVFSATAISFVPTTLERILAIDADFLKIFKAILVGGGHAESELIEKALHKGLNIFKVYGATETTSMITGADKNTLLWEIESVGKPLEDVKIKIFAENGTELPYDYSGLIGVKSQTIAKRYFLENELWEKKFIGEYFLTGDFGRLNREGYLFLEMRREDMIISGGENVNPKEVESAIRSFSSVKDAYVLGLPDKQWGEIVCALVETSEEITIEQLKEFLQKQTAGYKIPKIIVFTNQLPRNEMGKVERIKAEEILQNDSI